MFWPRKRQKHKNNFLILYFENHGNALYMASTYYFFSFNLLESNYVYFNHAYIRKFKAQLLLLSKYIDLNYVTKNTL